jgi:hypothetical protein
MCYRNDWHQNRTAYGSVYADGTTQSSAFSIKASNGNISKVPGDSRFIFYHI